MLEIQQKQQLIIKLSATNKKNMRHLILSLFVISFIGCKDANTDFFPYQPNSHKETRVSSITFDTLSIIPPVSSHLIESGIYNENIYIVDRHFCTVLTFSKDGEFLSKDLGKGGGPKETTIGRIATHTRFKDGSFMLLGYNMDHYLYSKDCDKKSSFTLNPSNNVSENIEDNPYTYTHLYTDMVCRSFDNNVYFSVRAEHPELNHLEHTTNFLSKSCNILEVDINKQSPTNVLSKGYPDIYKKNPNKYVVFSGINFDVDNKGNFYVSYEADSLIYLYDKNFKPIQSFGYAGRNMDCNYIPIADFADSRKNYRNERNTKGYYYWLEYEEETKTLFRTYKKGASESSDGLQIYKDKTLIADLDVPKNMRIMGYIAPYYYSHVICDDENENEKMTIYRFKL